MATPYLLNNQEQLEAAQLETNKKRDEFISSLSKEEQNKFKAVDKAVKILVDAKIPFYLYPILKSSNYPGKDQIWQYNSLGVLFDVSNKEQQKDLSRVNQGLFLEILNTLTLMIKADSQEEFFKRLSKAYSFWLVKQENYYKGIEEII